MREHFTEQCNHILLGGQLLEYIKQAAERGQIYFIFTSGSKTAFLLNIIENYNQPHLKTVCPYPLLRAMSSVIYSLFTLVGRWSHYCPSGWFSQVFKLFLSCCTCYSCFDPETDSTPLTAAALQPSLEFLFLPLLCFIGLQAETVWKGAPGIFYAMHYPSMGESNLCFLWSLLSVSVTILIAHTVPQTCQHQDLTLWALFSQSLKSKGRKSQLSLTNVIEWTTFTD